MPKSSSNRRTLSTFRMHLVVTCLTVNAVFATIITLSVFVPLSAHIDRAPAARDVSTGLAEYFLFLHQALWPLEFLAMIACIASALILYQRMRTPLVRFVRCFDEIGKGSVPKRVRIRAGDYLTEEADALNRMIDCLATHESERLRAAERFDSILDDLSSQGVDPILLEALSNTMKSGLHSTGQPKHDG